MCKLFFSSSFFLLAFLSFLVLATSCAPVLTTKTSKTLDIYGGGVMQKTVIADLDVKTTKVSGTAQGNSSQIEALKREATANAIKESNADILVEPQYNIQTKGSRATITVTGFPAFYVGFHQITKDEILLLEKGLLVKAETKETGLLSKNNKSLNRFILPGALGLGLLLLLLL